MQEIWFINQYAIAPDLPGGTRHYDFGVELVKMDYFVRIFAADVNLALRRQTRDLQGKLWLEEPINGVLYEWVRTSTYDRNDWRRALNAFNFSFNLYRAGLNQPTRPDLIIGSSPNLFAALAAYYLAKRLGSRFFFEVRDLWPQALIDMNSISAGHPMARILRRIEKKLYDYAEHIIVLAEGSIPYLKGKGVPDNRITYIPNGVHPDHFKPKKLREEARKVFGFDRFTLVYTGAHGPANALYTILGAANNLRDEKGIEFVLVGDGPAKADLQRQAQEVGLDNLRFMEPVAKSDMPDLLAAADAAVITLKDARTFYSAVSPNKLFDYLAAGLPVLCAVPGDMAKMVEQYGCGFASPAEDGKALAEQTRSLIKLSKQERDQMGARGRALAFDKFSRPKLVNRLVELLEKKEEVASKDLATVA